MPELTLEAALAGLGIEADEVLDYKVHPDHVIVVLIRGPKLIWPEKSEFVEPAPPEVETHEVTNVSDEAQRIAAELGIDLESIKASRPTGKITAKDVRLAAGRKKRA